MQTKITNQINNESRHYDISANISFIGGVAKVLDLGNTLNIYDKDTPSQILDLEALRHDWEKVGEDIYSSINIYEGSRKTTT